MPRKNDEETVVLEEEVPSNFVVKTQFKTDEQIEAEIKAKTAVSIKYPTIGRRVVAIATDFALLALTAAMVFLWAAMPIIAPIVEPYNTDLLSYHLSSGLTIDRDVTTEETGTVHIATILSYYYGEIYPSKSDPNVLEYWTMADHGQASDLALGYEYAADAILHQTYAFFDEFLSGMDGVTIPNNFSIVSNGVSMSFDALTLPSNFPMSPEKTLKELAEVDVFGPFTDRTTYFSKHWFNYRFLGLPFDVENPTKTYGDYPNPGYFAYKTDGAGNPLYNELGIINPNHFKGGLLDKDMQKIIANNLLVGAYSTASKIFNELSFIANINTQLTIIHFVTAFIVYVILYFVFYFFIPLFRRNGETLGFLATRLLLISKTGYSVKRIQIPARQLSLFVLMSLGILSLGLLMVVWLIIMVFSKNNRTLQDMFAGTQVIEKDRSVWFNSPEDEKKYNDIIRNDIEKLRSVDPNKGNSNRKYLK